MGSRTTVMGGRSARRLAVLLAMLVGLLGATSLVGAGAASARVTAQDAKSVIFIGDSVTAGFGYFGQKENAKNISGKVNNEFPSNWYFGDNSLSDCSPADHGTPIDQCSNNNFNGAPWSAGPWKDGADAPDVAYSYQIAKSQDPAKAAPVENWAITGSTPAMWDTGGAFNYQLKNIKDTTVIMTLGANPILSTFLKIRLSGINQVNGACADSTMWLGWTGWWAYPPSKAAKCAEQQWAQNQQTEHLMSVYQTLLKNNNKVLSMGYYRACPWSFGVWQPNGNVAKGPASGNSCPSQREKVSECSSCKVDGSTSQWDQAVAAQNAMNDKIAAAVGSTQAWARGAGIDPANLQFVLPDQSEWAKHQAWDGDSWVFKNDTWIHPSKAGHTQLAKTVTAKVCQTWGQWCGAKPAWNETPLLRSPNLAQTVNEGKVPDQIGNRSVKNLPALTEQKHPIGWTTSTSKMCEIFEGDLVAKKQDGKCKLTAYAAASDNHESMREKFDVKIK